MDASLRLLVVMGLMTEDQARDADAFADGLADQIVAGESTLEEAERLAGERAIADAKAFSKARQG